MKRYEKMTNSAIITLMVIQAIVGVACIGAFLFCVSLMLGY